MRAATAVLAGRGKRQQQAGGGAAGSITATIKYATSIGAGTFDNPADTVALHGATILGPAFVVLDVTSLTGTVAHVLWATKLGAGGYVTRRGSGEDSAAPYNPMPGAVNGVPISWWDNSLDGSFTLKATVVFTDETTQDITATFTVSGNVAPELPPPSSLGNYLPTYCSQPGDQIVVLANGTYTAGAVTAAHAATAGTYGGLLILYAESEGGVTIDLSDHAFQLLPTTSRIAFVGMRFINGNVQLTGCNEITFWFCEFTYPADEWHAWYIAAGGVSYPPAIPRTGGPPNRGTEWAKTGVNGNKSAQTPSVAGGAPYGRSTHIRFIGCDSHETCDDGAFLYDVDDLEIIGHRVWNIRTKTPIADDGSGVEREPNPNGGGSQDWMHNDGWQTVGVLERAVIADSWFGEKVQFAGEGKRLNACTFNRIWFAGCETFGMIAGRSVNSSGKITACTADTIRAFCNGQINGASFNHFCTDFELGVQKAVWPSAYNNPGLFEFVRTNVTTTIPSGISTTTVSGVPILDDINQVRDHAENPANVWRVANPYDSFFDYFFPA